MTNMTATQGDKMVIITSFGCNPLSECGMMDFADGLGFLLYTKQMGREAKIYVCISLTDVMFIMEDRSDLRIVDIGVPFNIIGHGKFMYIG